MAMSTELICLFDSDFVIIRVNEAWCRFFNVTQEFTLGRSFMDFVPWGYDLATRNDILDLGGECRAASHMHAAGFGIHIISWVQWTYRVILDEQGRTAAYEAVGQALSEPEWPDRRQNSTSTVVH